MNDQRRVWQHKFEDRSESQLNDAFGSVGWVVERLRWDYGEDLFGRPFEDGKPTGEDFFIQLKGTDDPSQYKLEKSDQLSISVKLINIKQWYSFTIPVIFIIWDINKNLGYWVHIQQFVREKLNSNSSWLQNKSGSETPERNVIVPIENVIQEEKMGTLKGVLRSEWTKINKGKSHFEIIYQASVFPDNSSLKPELPKNVSRHLRITELLVIVESQPSDSKNWLDLASLYYEVGELSKALQSINKAYSIDPENTNILQVRGCILAEYARINNGPKSMYEEAIDSFELILDDFNRSTINYNIGNCYSELGQYQKAIKHYETALSNTDNPKQKARIWTNYANSLSNIERIDEAINSYKKAIELDPSLWNAHASWAILELRRDRFKAANTHFREAIRCNDKLIERGDTVIYWYSYSLLNIGELNRALHIINNLLAVKPTNKNFILLKAHILNEYSLIDQDYLNEAIDYLKSKISDFPNDMELRSQLHQLYLSHDMEREYECLLKDTIKNENCPPFALLEYANLLISKNEIEEAITILEQAINSKIEDHELRHSISHKLAQLKEEIGEYNQAIYFYEIALEHVNDPLPIMKDINDCYHFLGSYKNCVVVITKALSYGAQGDYWWNNLFYGLQELGIDTQNFLDFLNERLYSSEEIQEGEILSKLDKMINKKI